MPTPNNDGFPPAALTSAVSTTKNTTSPKQLSRLPPSISHWFGYREAAPTAPPNYVIWISSFIGAFCGLSVIQAVFGKGEYFIGRGVPPIVGSYGAAAVLIYGAIEVPLAQPRAMWGGHFLGALTGVIITKLFLLLPEERFLELQWLAGSLACATSIVVMQMTNTTHPPAGASALLAATNKEVRDIGWYLLPVVLLSSTLALAVALITNNIARRYPTFWIAASSPAPHQSRPPYRPSGHSESEAEARERKAELKEGERDMAHLHV